MPIYEWGGGWLEYGEFDKAGIWHFDKKRIKHDLELGIKENELCPIVDRKRIFETLERLPDTINPKSDKNWQYRTSYEEVRGEFKEVAVGIRPVLKKANRYVVGNYKPYWEPESTGTSDASEKIIEVEPKRKSTSSASAGSKRPSKSNTSYGWFWVLVAVVVILYFIFG